jgi:hypothetical protein
VVHVALIGKKVNLCWISVGKLTEKRPLGRSRLRWWDNIKVDLTEITLKSVDWIYVSQDKDVW